MNLLEAYKLAKDEEWIYKIAGIFEFPCIFRFKKRPGSLRFLFETYPEKNLLEDDWGVEHKKEKKIIECMRCNSAITKNDLKWWQY